jgi:glutamyl-tRNA(Gln) amidotransferase subunit E
MAARLGRRRVKVGLEVHQQLATGKLFCECPCELSEEVHGSFTRRLRSASGENQAVDAATAFQAARELLFRYEIVDSSCLVDMDEEPPHPLNPAALDVALTLALLLEARPVDEIEVMRKIVVDGSNTAGFQRTALVAVDGHLDLRGKRYSILSICLEEDASRRVGESSGEVTYRLDRLGIPLVEIATGPDIAAGPEAREVAEELGALLRATRRTRRGIGTIREDVNVSTDGGRRIEIKGVQELRKIQDYVDREVGRQGALLGVRDELVRRGTPAPKSDMVDVTAHLSAIATGPLSESARRSGPILALRLPGFGGLLRAQPGSDERLGREFADQARSTGLRGLIHSDELPAFGVDSKEIERLRAALELGPRDAFVLVADRDRPKSEEALRRVAARATAALEGVPGETRDPLPDGRTRYSRPLPGRDRMYPETDIAPIPVLPDHLARLRARLPERPSDLRERLARETGLAREIVLQLVAGGHVDVFEDLVHRGRSPALAARVLIQDIPALPRAEGEPEREFSTKTLDEVLRAAEAGTMAKEGIPNVLGQLAKGAANVEAAVRAAGLSGFSLADLDALVERVVGSNVELLRSRGPEAFSPLMGDVMREVRGRRDGQEVAEAVRRSIARHRTDAVA